MPHVPDTVPGKRVHGAEARTEGRGQPSNIRGGTRIQESCTYGSVRGAPSNGRPYRNHETGSGFGASSEFRADRLSARRYPSGQSSASANPIERFRRIEEPTRRRMKAPALSAGHRGTESSNPFPSCGESVSAGSRGRCRPKSRMWRRSEIGLGPENGTSWLPPDSIGPNSLTGIDAVPLRQSPTRVTTTRRSP